MRLCTSQVFAVPERFSFSILNHVFLPEERDILSLPLSPFESSVLLGMIYYRENHVGDWKHSIGFHLLKN